MQQILLMFCMPKKKNITYLRFKHKPWKPSYSFYREKQDIILMISNGKICEAKSKEQRQRWYYLALKKNQHY